MRRSCSGECPYTHEIQTISIKYTDIPILGKTRPNYSKNSFDCDLYEDCPYKDECHIYRSAPDELE